MPDSPLAKPLSLVTADDIAAWLSSEPPESDTLEFKQQIPSKKGEADPWERGENRIGDKARTELLEEVVAFANAHGGVLVLGVAESADHPKRGVAVRPIRACADFAVRLSQQAGACIQPQLPAIEIRGVPVNADGAGVVLVRVAESASAPHRVMPLRVASIRRADRTEEMTMREIQDLTLQRVAASGRRDEEFARRRADFVKWIEAAMNSAKRFSYFGVRVTAISSVRQRVSRDVIRNVEPRADGFSIGDPMNQWRVALPPISWTSRPIVRGRRWTADLGGGTVLAAELMEEGLVEYTLHERPTEDPVYLLIEWPIAMLANALTTAHTLRVAAALPAAAYDVEFEIRREGGMPLTMTLFGGSPTRGMMALTPNPLLLPQYSFGEFDELPDLVGLATSDIMSAGGRSVDPAALRIT